MNIWEPVPFTFSPLMHHLKYAIVFNSRLDHVSACVLVKGRQDGWRVKARRSDRDQTHLATTERHTPALGNIYPTNRCPALKRFPVFEMAQMCCNVKCMSSFDYHYFFSLTHQRTQRPLDSCWIFCFQSRVCFIWCAVLSESIQAFTLFNVLLCCRHKTVYCISPHISLTEHSISHNNKGKTGHVFFSVFWAL